MPVELRLVMAFGFLKTEPASLLRKISNITHALLSTSSQDTEAMQGMNLHQPKTLKEKLTTKLVSYSLKNAAQPPTG